jgi:hypothetical protein
MDSLNVTDPSTDFESANVDSEWSFDVTFEFVVHGVLINSVGVLGLLGNVVSIVVLSRPQMKSSINTLLIGLVTIFKNFFVRNLRIFVIS